MQASKKKAFKIPVLIEWRKAVMNNNMWNTLSRFSHLKCQLTNPRLMHFLSFLKNIQRARGIVFDREFEANAKSLLDKYENVELHISGLNTLVMELLNSNFTMQETEVAIDNLKNNNSPGCDNIIKYCYNAIEKWCGCMLHSQLLCNHTIFL